MKSFGFAACVFVIATMATTSVRAQQVDFQSTPLGNTCVYPNTITLEPANIWLAPQDSKVVTSLVSSVLVLQNRYVPAQNLTVPPGTTCFFEQCLQASVTLACISPRSDGAITKVIFKYQKATSKPNKKK